MKVWLYVCMHTHAPKLICWEFQGWGFIWNEGKQRDKQTEGKSRIPTRRRADLRAAVWVCEGPRLSPRTPEVVTD